MTDEPTNWFGWDVDEDPEADAPKPWTLADIYADLASTEEVAERLNVTRNRVVAWISRRERTKCPQPIRRFAMVNVYSMQEWYDWFENFQKGKKPGTKWTDNSGNYRKAPKREVIWIPRPILREDRERTTD